jgi:hypothetical protein
MDGKFDEKLEIVTAAASKEIEYLFDKGEETFIKEMANETINGLSFMSKPAVLVLKVLHQYGADMMNRHAAEAIELTKKIDGYQQEFSRATKNATKCEVYDAAANKLMEAVNPMVLNFYQNKAEEYRVWLNALATWNWYVAGNPKNTIIVQDMGFTAWLESLYVAAMTEQLVYAPTCKPQKELTPVGITEPAIPNFICPAVVSIPVGADWQQLSKASKNFDNNTSGTKQNTNNPVPNTSISFGIGDMIAQPGKAPFIKTANGSISPGMINSAVFQDANHLTSAELCAFLYDFAPAYLSQSAPAEEEPAAAHTSMVDWRRQRRWRFSVFRQCQTCGDFVLARQ